ncbi:MAG: Trk family potassium uptake protein [Dehalococcoidia bacterium]|nr:Trk family potassium uptake protein [Dehalococcoidia bacterium]MCA9844067.1 Trk family potassium uptake protein [Dehalococcoidia bacterium]
MTSRRPIRRRVNVTFDLSLPAPQRANILGSGWTQIAAGFGLVILIGTVLLMLPITTESGSATHPLDALFTAVSATCVTGLVVVETQEHWNFFGELVILVMIQIGGLGYMVGTSILLWMLGRRLSVRGQFLLRQYYGAPTVGEAAHFARNVIAYAAIFEVVGVVVLWFAFVEADVSPGESAWWALFHSVSAFNNAGFAVTGADMIPYAGDPFVLMPIAFLVIAGSVGAIPVLSLTHRRTLRALSLDTKLIFVTTAGLLVVGCVYILLAEWTNPETLGRVSSGDRPVLAFFQSAMPRTAGFSAVDAGAMSDETKFLQVGLMFIGGAAGSTAGGIKVGTFSILLIAIVATLRGSDDMVGFGRRVPAMVIRQALTLGLLMVAATFGLATILLIVGGGEFVFIDVLYEAQSALSTVGLSGGITAEFNEVGRLAIVAGMILGRFGPLILVLEMTKRRPKGHIRLPEDSIRIG